MIKSSAFKPLFGKIEIPTLIVVSNKYSSKFIGSLKSFIILFAIFSIFFCSIISSITIINSSPPIRDKVSFFLMFFCNLFATRLIILSPIVCPYVSFMILKLSISIKNIASLDFKSLHFSMDLFSLAFSNNLLGRFVSGS